MGHLLKAHSPMYFTPSGIVTLDMPELINAMLPILSIVSGITISVTPLHSMNAPDAIFVTL